MLCVFVFLGRALNGGGFNSNLNSKFHCAHSALQSREYVHVKMTLNAVYVFSIQIHPNKKTKKLRGEN